MTNPLPVPVVLDAFDELMERVVRLNDRLDRGTDQLLDNAGRAARLLPDQVASQVRTLGKQLVALGRHVIDELVRLIDRCGKPWRVWRVGALWAERFSGPLSEHVGEMNRGNLAAAYEWEGTASEAYEDTLARQQAALAALQLIGTDTHTALGNAAVAICALWAAVAAALLVAAAQLIAAGVAAATVVGAPGALAFAFGSLASLLTGLSVAVGAFMLVVERANDAMSPLRDRLYDRSGFGVGWPDAARDRIRNLERWKLAE